MEWIEMFRRFRTTFLMNARHCFTTLVVLVVMIGTGASSCHNAEGHKNPPPTVEIHKP